jgi:hypothetical protein
MQEESPFDVLVGLGSWIEWQIVSTEISRHLRCCFLICVLAGDDVAEYVIFKRIQTLLSLFQR